MPLKLKIKISAGVLILVISIILYFTKTYFIAGSEIYLAKDQNSTTNSEIVTNESKISTASDAQINVESSEIAKQIIIDISGEIKNPMVITLPEGSRVYQAIKIAGGLKSSADLSQINQAAILSDGEKIIIPKLGSNSQASTGNTNTVSNSGENKLININTANLSQLDAIQGVGPTTAQNIINFRNENGNFKKIDEIKNVTGIGDKTFEKLKGQISVN